MQVLVISFAIAMKDHTSDFLNKLINTNTTEMILVLSADKNQYTLCSLITYLIYYLSFCADFLVDALDYSMSKL